MFIYRILNKETKIIYIGSTYDFEKRKQEHLSELKKGIHFNRFIQDDFNFYGENCFEFKILSNPSCNRSELYEIEAIYIEAYWKRSYNLYRSSSYKKYSNEFHILKRITVEKWLKRRGNIINECIEIDLLKITDDLKEKIRSTNRDIATYKFGITPKTYLMIC